MAYNQQYIVQMQLMKFDLFKSQNPEIGRFDVIFEVGGKLLYAHRNMLNLVSDTFDSMLSDRWTKKDSPVKIADYSYGDFYQFLTFLYSGRCELTDSNISKMVDIAEFYGVDPFKTFCDEFLSAVEISAENIFQLMELAEKYSMVQLKASTLSYITKNFKSFAETDGFLGAEKSVIQEIFTSVKDNVKAEDLLQAVYKWCEKQSTDAQSADPTLNLNDAIKVAMSDLLPNIRFDKMEPRFLLEFVLPRGFIFPSLDELSIILCDRILPPKVKITNPLGQTLHGELKCDNAFIDAIKALKNTNSIDGNDIANWWKCKKFTKQSPSPLKKRDGVEWYLTYHATGEYIGYVHRSVTLTNEYLLAELTTESSDFKAMPGSKIE